MQRNIIKKNLVKNFDDNNIVILMTARFSPQKDQNTIIRSLTKLPKKYVAVFAGDGELIENSKKLVRELNLEERVVFLGFRKDIPEITKNSRYYSDIVSSGRFWTGSC